MYTSMTTTTFVRPYRISDIRDVCVFDLETTGVCVETARIVSGYAGRVTRDNEIQGEYNWLANPGIPIPEGAAAVHGINDEMVKDAPSEAQVTAEMVDVLSRSVARGRPIVGFNIAYDLSLLNNAARRHGIAPIEDFGCVIDPLIIDKHVDKWRKGSRKLVDSAKYYGVPLDEDAAHDARNDALATGGVAWAVLNKLLTGNWEGDVTLENLHNLQVGWARDQQLDYQNYRRQGSKGRNGNPDKAPEPEFILDPSWPIKVGEVTIATWREKRIAELAEQGIFVTPKVEDAAA